MTQRKTNTPEIVAAVLKSLAANSNNRSSVAKELSMRWRRVRDIARDHGIPPSDGRGWTKAETTRLTEMLDSGVDQLAIASEMNKAIGAVASKARHIIASRLAARGESLNVHQYVDAFGDCVEYVPGKCEHPIRGKVRRRDRVEVMAGRVARGEDLYHEDDCPDMSLASDRWSEDERGDWR